MFNAQVCDPDSWDLIAFLMFSSLTSTISSPNVTNIVVAAATMSGLGVLVLIILATFRFFGVSSLLSTCTRLDLDLLGLFSTGLEDAAFGAASDVAFVLGGFLSFSFAFEACSDLALVLGAALGFSLVLGAVFNFWAALLVVSVAGVCSPVPASCLAILLRLSFPSHHA